MKIVVKDWFHEKKMNEMHKNVQSTRVFAILKETEKAYNVFVGDSTRFMAYWVPKSCVNILSEQDAEWQYCNDAIEGIDFETAMNEWNLEMSFYR